MYQDQYRNETDSFGEIKVREDRLWGANTQRSLQNFKIGIYAESIYLGSCGDLCVVNTREVMRGELINALILIKRIAAQTNAELGVLDIEKSKMIIAACDELLKGGYEGHFPLTTWQTGSGTQTNMNVNEVIANLVAKQHNLPLGKKTPIHPNDHVNMGQSSNDTFPSAMNIALYMVAYNKLLPALQKMHDELLEKVEKFNHIIKIGRTHLQDATPLSLGQEFSGYAAQIEYSILRVKNSIKGLQYLAQGGTAVGTGINCHKDFGVKFAQNLSKFVGLEFKTADNKFEALASHDNIVYFSGALNCLATSLMKIANDIRLLGSGPRCGLGELSLPENEAGSSIMPGKVNPTQCEALTMICAQVMGNHVAITVGGSNGHMELNVFKPVIVANALQSLTLLSDGIESFVSNCLQGLSANETNIHHSLNNSLMLVTALNPYIGYDNAAKIAKLAHQKNLSLKQAAIELNLLDEKRFDEIVRPEKMIG